jgi:5'-nucleotidase
MRSELRDFRAATLALAAALALAASAGADGFTILQVNDVYKIEGLEAGAVGGLARLRALRAAIEAEGRDVLVVVAGDLLFPSVMSKYLEGRAMVAALNRLDGADGHDDRLVVGFGNHEFDARDPAVLFGRLAESEFGWLSADVAYRLDGMVAPAPFAGHAPNVAATRLIELGGVRLGLFGSTMAGEPRPWLRYSESLDDRVAAAADAVAELRARGAELVIAVTHQEVGDDERLAARVEGIDWIAGGHEHVRLERRVGATGITKADADARTVVRLDVDRGAGGLELRHRFVDLGAEVAPDPAMLGEVARWLVRLEEAVRARTGASLLAEVATTEHALEGIEPAIRGRETALGNFLADVLRARLTTELALINGGAIRINDDIPAGGSLRVYEMEGIFYYDNRPVAFAATGAEILELLRRSVADAALAHGRFLQVSGVRFRYRAPTAAGEPARVEAADVEIAAGAGFRPLELDRRYSVATLDWLLDNGCRDGYALFSAGCGGTSPARLERPPLSWRAITEEAIAGLPGRRITNAIDGRIVAIVGNSEED